MRSPQKNKACALRLSRSDLELLSASATLMRLRQVSMMADRRLTYLSKKLQGLADKCPGEKADRIIAG